MNYEPLNSKREIILRYQNYIESPPVVPKQLHAQAYSNDVATIESWRPTWIDNFKMNHEKFGPFKDRSIGKFYELMKNKPCIVAGSGPSLKNSIHLLKDRGDVGLVSCLHNFHFMEDNNANPDFYVTLDAGAVTIEEVSEGGTKTPDEYWEQTKGKKLLAYVGANPELLQKWQGEIYFFACPVPDDKYLEEIKKIEEFYVYVGTGGNVLGACLYIAKGFLAANPIAFIGADFSFGYDSKFHAWNSKYDTNLGKCLRATDIFGNRVLTWQSYHNFKCWFDWVATVVPGIYFNCSDGGIFGAYENGNLLDVRQIPLSSFIQMYKLHEHLKEQVAKPDVNTGIILF